jgi:hypothetical protein
MNKQQSIVLHQKNRWVRIFSLSWADRLLLFEASIFLGLARIIILVFPFRFIARLLGSHMAESPASECYSHHETLKTVSWVISVMSRYLPWDCKCLVQAIAAQWMLRIRGILSTLYLGVSKNDSQGLIAHAWLRSGHVTLTGSHEKKQFTVISSFGAHNG